MVTATAVCLSAPTGVSANAADDTVSAATAAPISRCLRMDVPIAVEARSEPSRAEDTERQNRPEIAATPWRDYGPGGLEAQMLLNSAAHERDGAHRPQTDCRACSAWIKVPSSR